MASVWIRTRKTTTGAPRYRIEFRLGGRESRIHYAGSFRTRREALARRAWVVGEIAAMRVPDLSLLDAQPVHSPTVIEAAARWKASRVDVAETTRVLHRVALDRVVPIVGARRIDDLSPADITDLIATLHASGRKRETIRKSVSCLAQVLDHAGVDPNPARDRVHVRLPREERDELEPPTSADVESVFSLLDRSYRLPLLWLDWSGARVGSIDALCVSDYDRSRHRVRLRASTSKTRRALWIDLPDELATAIDAMIDSRDIDARLFAEITSDALRTAIARACVTAGIAVWSPHDLRHRRISLLHRQGRSWAEIAAFVGQRSLRVTADTYTHVLLDDRELDYRKLLSMSA